MNVALGTEVYNADSATVIARGYEYSQADLENARSGRLEAVLTDAAGRDRVAELYSALELTEFGTDHVVETMKPIPEEGHSRGWREGEALAEAWLADHRHCEFPWPFNRDLRHHKASMPGAELVGFTGESVDQARFAFGQVKTSKESRTPPQVVNQGEKCLINQALQLRDDARIKKTVVDYLAYRAQTGASWALKFRAAATRYFNSGTMEVALFGVLVRDVRPVHTDLNGAAARLAADCHPSTRIEFCGLYLPEGSIPAGPQHALRPQRRRDS
jgi:hypothetical protein